MKKVNLVIQLRQQIITKGACINCTTVQTNCINCTWNELRRLEMLVERALTLELTPSPEDSVTREASERTQVSEVSILGAD